MRRKVMRYGLEKERCEKLGEYVVAHRATVRQTARVFSISKSTVHKDVTIHLQQTNHALYLEVKEVLEANKQERHIRGGEATRQKYLNSKKTSGENVG